MLANGTASGPLNTRHELDLIIAKKDDVLAEWMKTEQKVAELRRKFQGLEAEASIHGVQLHAKGGPRQSVYDEMNNTSTSENLEKLKKRAAKNRGLLDKMAEKGKSEKEYELEHKYNTCEGEMHKIQDEIEEQARVVEQEQAKLRALIARLEAMQGDGGNAQGGDGGTADGEGAGAEAPAAEAEGGGGNGGGGGAPAALLDQARGVKTDYERDVAQHMAMLDHIKVTQDIHSSVLVNKGLR